MAIQTPPRGYLPRDSFVHRLDPLTKFTILLLVAILTVTLVSDIVVLAIFLFLLVGFVGARISIGYAVRRLRRLLTFIILIAFVQLLFTPYGTILFFLIPPLVPGFGPFLPITTAGITNAINLAFRLINIVLASTLFVATTDPTLFAASLNRLRVPYRYSFILVLALRLVPLFDQEASIVQNAQLVRGIPVDRGLIHGFLRRIRYSFLPLIFSAITRVDSLTLAMDGRGFGYAKTRTYLRRPSFRAIDWLLTSFAILLTVFFIWFFLFIMPLPSIFP